ncbi:MAG TPA: tetratricopeptide repeat protein, partial [Kofleriaceae bacterium]
AAAVRTSFADWRKVPEALRVPDRIAWYSRGLMTVAGYFAERRGDPSLRDLLIGNIDDNPVVRWERTLRSVEPLIAALDYERAAELLRAALADGEQLQAGTAIARYLPVTCGRLGECLFQLGDADGAAAQTERAYQLARDAGDRDGERIYLGNLAEIERYRGHPAAAAARFTELAALLEATRLGHGALEVAHYRRRAAVVGAGEPRCRVVADVDGLRFEIAELIDRPPTGKVQFVFERDRVQLRRSIAAVQAGIDAGTRGDPEAALRHFQTAMTADPHDPWPHYHAGMALLELGRYPEAAQAYAAAEARAPGWYHCRADRWLAEQLATGAIDRDTFTALRQLDDPGLSPDQAAQLAAAGNARHPLPAFDLALGNALRKLGRDGDAAAAYRRGVAAATEPDVRTRLLVALAGSGMSPDRARLLDEAIALDGNLVAAAMARLIRAAPRA